MIPDIILQVTERRTANDGTPLLFPEIEVATFWTNLYADPVSRSWYFRTIP